MNNKRKEKIMDTYIVEYFESVSGKFRAVETEGESADAVEKAFLKRKKVLKLAKKPYLKPARKEGR
jgi:hypothetical protein